jgi:hypothetical protein
MAFNHQLRDRAVEELQEAVDLYNRKLVELMLMSEEMIKLGSEDCPRILTSAEAIFSSMANTPPSAAGELVRFREVVQAFDKEAHKFDMEPEDAAPPQGISFGRGMLIGAGAVLALKLASTLLSGRRKRGAGRDSRPFGLRGGALGLISGTLFQVFNNKREAEQATSERLRIEANIESLDALTAKMGELTGSIRYHVKAAEANISTIQAHAPQDYRESSEEQKQRTGDLIGHIQSLTMLLKRRVDADAEG